MKIVLLCVGKMRNGALSEVCADYLTRLQRFGSAEVREVKASTRNEINAAREEESQRLEKMLEPADRVFVLDERGAQYTSVQCAELMGKLERESARRMIVALGGAYGMTDAFKKRGQLLGLSKLTLPHELCRAVLLEQLYRARTIQQGLPYHHA